MKTWIEMFLTISYQGIKGKLEMFNVKANQKKTQDN